MPASSSRQTSIIRAIKKINRKANGVANAANIALEMPAEDGVASYDPRGIAQTLRPMRTAGTVDYDADAKTYSIASE